MSAPKFLAVNLASQTFAYSNNTEAAYPITNLSTYYSSDVWMSANHPDIADFLTFDFASATSCSALVIANHNLHLLGVNVDLEAADDSGFTSNKVTVSANIASGATSAPIVKSFNAVSKRYWRLAVSDSASVEMYIGNLFLGAAVTFDSTYEWDYSVGNYRYTTNRTETLDGRVRMSQTSNGKPVHRISFNLQTDTAKEALRTMLTVARGGLYPFYFIDTGGYAWLVRIADDVTDIISHRYNVNNFTLNLEAVEA